MSLYRLQTWNRDRDRGTFVEEVAAVLHPPMVWHRTWVTEAIDGRDRILEHHCKSSNNVYSYREVEACIFYQIITRNYINLYLTSGTICYLLDNNKKKCTTLWK